jgi:hypothetical protein
MFGDSKLKSITATFLPFFAKCLAIKAIAVVQPIDLNE